MADQEANKQIKVRLVHSGLFEYESGAVRELERSAMLKKAFFVAADKVYISWQKG